MFNLTQRAWNNVIIFAMLFMVYLFSISNKLIVQNNDDARLRFLLPEHSVIMKISFPEVALERIGQSWRSRGSDRWAMDILQSLIHNWSHLVVYEQDFARLTDPYIVTMLLAGEEKPRVVQIASVTDGLRINYAGKSFLVSDYQLDDLIPL